jgi:hypothetical protein
VLRSNTAKHGSVSWVATSCLVPEGLPTAAAAEADGGLACMEVVCRVLVLQDCCPAAASPGLVKALSKGVHMLTCSTHRIYICPPLHSRGLQSALLHACLLVVAAPTLPLSICLLADQLLQSSHICIQLVPQRHRLLLLLLLSCCVQ